MEIIINGYKMNITLINILEFIFIISACVVVFILFISVDTYIKFVFLYSFVVILIIILGIDTRYNALMISNQEVIFRCDEINLQLKNLRSKNIIV